MNPNEINNNKIFIDKNTNEIHIGGYKQHLTRKESDLFFLLMKGSPNYVTKQQIIDEIWPSGHICGESVTQLIKRLRKAIRDDAKTLIINTPCRGYRLTIRTENIHIECESTNRAQTIPTDNTQANSMLDSTSWAFKPNSSKTLYYPIAILTMLVLILLFLNHFVSDDHYSPYGHYEFSYNSLRLKNIDNSLSIEISSGLNEYHCRYDASKEILHCIEI